jgi:hypothetical protein
MNAAIDDLSLGLALPHRYELGDRAKLRETGEWVEVIGTLTDAAGHVRYCVSRSVDLNRGSERWVSGSQLVPV